MGQEGQEALAAECVAQATPCWERLEECTVSCGEDDEDGEDDEWEPNSAVCSSQLTVVQGGLITVSSTHTCMPDMMS